MRDNWILVFGGIALAALTALSVVLVYRVDYTAPVITFTQDIHYDDSQDISVLLEGVSAMDDKDGDVTDAILVESLIVLEDLTSAKVTYAVKDHSNNVAKAYRIVEYSGSGESIFTSSTGVLEEWPEISSPSERATTEPPTQQMTEPPTQATESVPESTQDTTTQSTSETTSETTTKETTTQETTTAKQNNRNPQAPVLTLKRHEGSIELGGFFNVASYVENITDDEDTREELFRRIGIEGTYNANQPGDYTFYIYCIDTKKNLSNKEKFVLHVGN